MAPLKPVQETSGIDLGLGKYKLDNSAQLVKLWSEIAKRGIQDETELNSLRMSNLTRLGNLRKGQEKEILDAAIAANHRIIEDRANRQRAAIKEEIDEEIKARLRIARKTAKASGKKVSKEEEAHIAEQVKIEKAAKYKAVDEVAAYAHKRAEADAKKELADAIKRKKAELEAEAKERANMLFGEGKSLKERAGALKEMFTTDEDGNNNGMKELMSALADMAKQLDSQMDEIASKKGLIDTRLQGSKSNKTSMGSYWERMT